MWKTAFYITGDCLDGEWVSGLTNVGDLSQWRAGRRSVP